MTRGAALAVALAASLAGCAHQPQARQTTARVLRVCADPNNLPYSNQAGEGFENRIAALLASDSGATLQYTWWAQRRGFVRHTLKAHACDVLIGVPSGFDLALTTIPYYRSTYVFVTRRDRRLRLASFDDPRLAHLRIGVQMIGDDGTNTPPAHELSRRGLIANVVGYEVYGDYARPNPTANIMYAVEQQTIDAAVVWGPQAGFFARSSPTPLVLTPVDSPGRGSLPLAFDMSMGVRHGDATRRDALNDFLRRRRGDIQAILAGYGIPRLDAAPAETR